MDLNSSEGHKHKTNGIMMLDTTLQTYFISCVIQFKSALRLQYVKTVVSFHDYTNSILE